jgi:xylulose-5-phosphate/fructose-6-phosphate phosphoketolase
VRRARGWASAGGELAADLLRTRDELLARARRDGEDPEEITGWRWSR